MQANTIQSNIIQSDSTQLYSDRSGTEKAISGYITEESICSFEQTLKENDKSKATIEKYGTTLRKMMEWLNGRKISHVLMTDYRDYLRTDHAVTTVNGALSAINSYLDFENMPECKLKLQKVQKKVFRSADREISRFEYFRLISTARRLGQNQLALIMETICSIGIRVSELEYITVEAVNAGYAEVTLKGKTRTIFIQKKLGKKLKDYIRTQKITQGSIFLTRNGTPISRKQIWARMKSICKDAGVKETKVFPHNLRHLFAQCYYKETHDLSRLADMLGHSSLNTTRIYLTTTGVEHAKALENLRLVS